MSSVAKITEAIRRLSANDRWNLLHRFSDELWDDWDSQIQKDRSNRIHSKRANS